MEILLCFAGLVMVLPLAMHYLAGSGGKAGKDLLEASFATQQAMVHGLALPASHLRIIHRWRTHAMTNRWGRILAIDASWLCQTPDGSFVLAIGQCSEDILKYSMSLREPPPLDIYWTWRNLSEARVRQMLASMPRTYRKVFGASPKS